jgi:anti-sigma B factor antagonist
METPMASRDARMTVQQDGEIVKINLLDRNILEEAAIQQIGEEISSLIEQSANPKILISFSSVEHLSSAALGTLITINNKVRQKAGQLRLSNIDPQIYEVFVITRLNKLFQIFDDVDQAVDSFK